MSHRYSNTTHAKRLASSFRLTDWYGFAIAILLLPILVTPAAVAAPTVDGTVDDTTVSPEVQAEVDDSQPLGVITSDSSADVGAASEDKGFGRRETLIASLTVFVLSVFLGFELITKVPPTLHTPLMSGSNAISGITLVGAILTTGLATKSVLIPILGMLAVIMATVNAVGGFAVTHRMLGMFRRK